MSRQHPGPDDNEENQGPHLQAQFAESPSAPQGSAAHNVRISHGLGPFLRLGRSSPGYPNEHRPQDQNESLKTKTPPPSDKSPAAKRQKLHFRENIAVKEPDLVLHRDTTGDRHFVDIIAVHGPGQDPDTAWRTKQRPRLARRTNSARSASGRTAEHGPGSGQESCDAVPDDQNPELAGTAGSKRGTHWLWDTDMVLQDFPHCRVFTFVYPDLDPGTSWDKAAIKAASEKLIEKLSRKCGSGYTKVPILFVGYGLGTVIIQHGFTSEMATIQKQCTTSALFGAGCAFLFLDGTLPLELDAGNPASPHAQVSHTTTMKAIGITKPDLSVEIVDPEGRSPEAKRLIPREATIIRQIWKEFDSTLAVTHAGDIWVYKETPDSHVESWSGISIDPVEDECHDLSKFAGRTSKAYEKVRDAMKLVLGLIAAAQPDSDHLFQHVVSQGMSIDRLLLLAASAPSDRAVQRLVRRENVNISNVDHHGNTALHLVTLKARFVKPQSLMHCQPFEHVVKTLIRGGIDPSTSNHDQKTALGLLEGVADLEWLHCLLGRSKLALGPSKRVPKSPEPRLGLDDKWQKSACQAKYAHLIEFYWGSRPKQGVDYETPMDETTKELRKGYLGLEDTYNRDMALSFLGGSSDGSGPEEGPEEYRISPQNVTVYDLLYGDGPWINFLRCRDENVGPDRTCTWIHLPANNEHWVKDLFLKMRISDSSLKVGRREGTNLCNHFMTPKVQQYLQGHPSSLDLNHAMYGQDMIGPRPLEAQPIPKEATCIWMPFLTFELHGHRLQLTQIMERLDQKGDLEPTEPLESEDPAWRMLVESYLRDPKSPLHCRRTLDQFYYHMLEDTTARDADQVTYKWAGRKLDAPVIMVDQLWLWILDGKLAITAFSDTCEKDAKHSLLQSVRSYIQQRGRDPIHDVRDLTGVILQHCVDFVTKEGPKGVQFKDCFQAEINRVVDKEADLFRRFKNLAQDLSRSSTQVNLSDRELMSNALFDIAAEAQLLEDIKDIIDELNMVAALMEEQKTLLRKLDRTLAETPGSQLRLFQGRVAHEAQQSCESLSQHHDQNQESHDSQRYVEAMETLNDNIRVVHGLNAYAGRVQRGLKDLLELKQTLASAWEARTTRESAEESKRQAKAIMIFTVVTIVFLPLSFVTSFMALQISSFPKDNQGNVRWPPGEVSSYIFGISVPLSLLIIGVSFSITYPGTTVLKRLRIISHVVTGLFKTNNKKQASPPALLTSRLNGGCNAEDECAREEASCSSLNLPQSSPSPNKQWMSETLERVDDIRAVESQSFMRKRKLLHRVFGR